MDILVLGGSGFLSGSVVKELVRRSHNVSFVTRNENVDHTGYVDHYVGERNDEVFLRRRLFHSNFDVIIDCSSYTKDDVRKFICNTEICFTHYIYISSLSVYDKTGLLYNEEQQCTIEGAWDDLGAAKLQNEQFLLKMNEKAIITIIRPAYIYGVGNRLHRENYYFDRALKNSTIYVPKADYHVHFVYIDDIVQVICSLLETAKKSNIINIGSPESIQISDFVKAIIRITNSYSNIVYVDNDKIPISRYFPFHGIDFTICTNRLKANYMDRMLSSEEGLNLIYSDIKENGIRTANMLLYTIDRLYMSSRLQ